MLPLDELENLTRQSHKLVCEYRSLLQLSNDPKEQLRCKRLIDEQWNLIEEYLTSYLAISRNQNSPIPEDIKQIMNHFPNLLAEDFRLAYEWMRHMTPLAAQPMDRLVNILRELDRLHAHIDEWKELHNLLQECVTALIPLKSEVESMLDRPTQWRKPSGLRLWEACRSRIHRLEAFAGELKCIDKPFYRGVGMLNGPVWMVRIASLRDEVDVHLKESGLEQVYDAIASLWDECFTQLDKADKHLRGMVTDLCVFSNSVLRSIDNGSIN